MKKKLLFESSSNHKKDREGSKSSKNQSFDYPGSKNLLNSNENILLNTHFLDPLQAISLTRSGSFMSAAANVSAASRQQQPSTQQQPQQKGSFDGNSDDSMHEKYFKSVESTPVSRRRHTTSSKTAGIKQSSDSSPQSPVSPLNPVRIIICSITAILFY